VVWLVPGTFVGPIEGIVVVFDLFAEPGGGMVIGGAIEPTGATAPLFFALPGGGSVMGGAGGCVCFGRGAIT
jgi:hypothetical protein